MTHILPVDPRSPLLPRLWAEQQRRTRYRTLLGKAHVELSLGDARVELVPHEGGVVVDVDQAIVVTGPCDGAVLGADLTGSPFRLERITTSSGVQVSQYDLGMFFGPADWRQFQSTRIRYQFLWDAREFREPSILLLPTNLLRSGVSVWSTAVRTAVPAPRLQIVFDERLQGLRASQVRGIGSTGASSLPIAASVGASEGVVDIASSAIGLACTPSLVTRLGSGFSAFRDHVNEAVASIVDLLGPAPVEALLISEDDRVFAPGDLLRPVVEIEPWLIGQIGSRRPAGVTFEFIRLLTGLYWGLGCQLIGAGAFETKDAIGASVALVWANQHSPSDLSSWMAALQRQSGQSRLRNALRGRIGLPRTQAGAAITVALADTLLRDAEGRAIRRTTKDFWGLQASPSIVLEAFGVPQSASQALLGNRPLFQ